MSRFGQRERPDWFDHSTKTVLDRSSDLLTARGPAELEQLTAELLGAELYRIAQSQVDKPFFDWWFEELVGAAAARARGHPDGASQPHWWLLHGLVAIGGPALRSLAETARDELGKQLRGQLRTLALPSWLRQVSRARATGEVWQLRDAYGARLGFIAGYTYPGGRDRSVFLFDIDACGFARVDHAGMFKDVEQAAAAWRAYVGEPAGGAQPVVLDSPARLLALTHSEFDEQAVHGDESRSAMDNWFRARRRLHDLADTMRRRGTPIPATQSLYKVDPEPMAAEFTAWYAHRNGTEPDPESTIALAEEWMKGALPDTWHAASPHRIEFRLSLIDDNWDPDDPVTIELKSLLPEWIRWHGEQAGTPSALVDRAVAVAQGAPRTPSDCPGLTL